MSEHLRAIQNPPPIAIGAGLVALDAIIPYGAVKPAHLRAGGTCGNVLTILGYLGWTSYPVARLGADRCGDVVRKDLTRWGIQLDFVTRTPDGSTPVYIQRTGRTADGDPVHSFTRRCPACSRMLPGFKSLTGTAVEQLLPSIPKANAFFFDRATRGTLMLAHRSAEHGAVIMFEPSGIGEPHLFREAVQISHIVKYSRDRIGEADEVLSDATPALQIETLGGDGLRYRSRLSKHETAGWKTAKAIRATVIRDTSGAGDWSSAGILHALAQGGHATFSATKKDDLLSALRFGQALSAWNCGFDGARGGMYSMKRQDFISAVEAIIAEGKATESDMDFSTAELTDAPTEDFCSLCGSA